MTTTQNWSPDDRPFFRAVIILLRHWRFLALTFAAAAVIAAIVAFLIPNTYRATASFLPPQKQSNLLESVTSGLSSTLKSFGIGGKGAASPTGVYSYLSILGSRGMGERMIKRFDLMKVYDIPDRSVEKTLTALSGNVEFNFEDEGHITISVEDSDPKRAAEMANTYVEYLNEINSTLGSTEAKSNRIFIEQQYNETVNSLKTVETSFLEFQKRTKIFSLPDQSKAALTAAANAYAQLMYQQVSVSIAEKAFGSEDAEVQLQKSKLDELRKILGNGSQSSFGDLLPSMKDMPTEGLEYMRLYRDYEIYSKFLGFLLPMVQQARVDEHRQAQAVVLLDAATPPELKYKPKRSIIIGISALSILVLAILFVLIRERFSYYTSLHSDEWNTIRHSITRKS